MFLTLPLSLTILLCISYNALAAPRSELSARESMSLNRRAPTTRTVEDWGIWAKQNKQLLESKYSSSSPGQHQKRGSGTNLLVNQNADSDYYGTVAIGTPAIAYNVILDTGSADLWLADADCLTGCSGIPTFDAAGSSTFVNLSTPFQITYGSGEAVGTLGQDVVQMAGFSVSNQIFATCDLVSSGLLSSPLSGLMGLAFQTIAASKASPFWQTLVSQGAWDEPVMAFYLSRFNNVSSAQTLEPGGSFDMGFTNSSLYTGQIEYVDLATTESYWILSLASITVQGNSVTVGSGSSSYAAIDTGTTLVGGPSDVISEIYAQIPGSAVGTGNFEGYYTYPCSTDVEVSVSFGNGSSWSINSADFKLSKLTSTTCLGAFFELNSSGTTPSWIFGDTFLKNVYSVFRYNPPSVGFAQLSSAVVAQNGVSGPIPSATIGTAATTVATGSSNGGTANGQFGQAVSKLSIIAMGACWIMSALVGSVLLY